MQSRSPSSLERFRAVDPGRLRGVLTGIGALVLGALFVRHAYTASLVADGVRHFWLDDDQMISMRYARNLAEGHGLVWNPGEYVEGYSNLLWTLFMALVHWLGASDAHAAVPVLVLCWASLVVLLHQGLAALEELCPRSPLLAVLLTYLFVTEPTVIWWSMSGYEISIMAAIQMAVVVRLLRRDAGLGFFVLLALFPLVRSDGLHVFLVNAVLAVALLPDRRRTALLAAAGLIPLAVHFLVRHAYYGEWLPNTYYLKAVGLPDKYMRGLNYLGRFANTDRVLLAASAGASLVMVAKRDLRALVPLGIAGGTMAYTVLVGGDNFNGIRFFAVVIPVLLVFAVYLIALVTDDARPVSGSRAALVLVLAVGVHPQYNLLERLGSPSHNGNPYREVRAGLLLRANAPEGASVAVMPAGHVPYFSRLRAIDMLGLSDHYIARLDYRPHSVHAHGKWDVEHSLGRLEPDYFASALPHGVVMCAPSRLRRLEHPEGDFHHNILSHPIFRQQYLDGVIRVDLLMQTTAIYAREGTRAFAERESWRLIEFSDNRRPPGP